ncbi:MAG: glycosyltransferase [Peptostreptococcaceae bacterium]
MINNGFSIITVTNRKYCIDNILKNYYNQMFTNKELIIIINSDYIEISDFSRYTNDLNVRIFNKLGNVTLGECLNFAIEKCNYDFIAKFDDDDYYGVYYIQEAFNIFSNNSCAVVGKSRTYYYIEKNNELMLKKIGNENKYSNSIMGSTICFKKEVYQKIKFRHISSREDYYFNKDCINSGYRIFSSSSFNHIVFKHSDEYKHTFMSNIEILMGKCEIIKENISFEESFKFVDFLT